MNRILIALLVALLVLSYGCIEKSQKLGCCAKENATDVDKCQLFNMTKNKLEKSYLDTNNCDASKGYCNVTIDKKDYLLPFCSEDILSSCIKPDCEAMVCGDFTYKPRIAPGIPSEEELDESTPVIEEEEAVQGLHNAQCRFYEMDSKFKFIMKNSNGAINRFRFGVGDSFDEYDLYKNYFPMSDRYCALNPLGEVDRFMNYIDSTPAKFDAKEEIKENCVNDSATTLGPFTFGDSTNPTDILPEKSSYKFAEYYKLVRNATGVDKFAPLTFADIMNPTEKYKKLDKTWYMKKLASLYADDFYQPNAPRAPFECTAKDCMSGVCRTDYYSRGVSITVNDEEVPTDCHSVKGPSNSQEVICFPTRWEVVPKTGGKAPTINYAGVTVRPWRFNYYLSRNYNQKDISENPGAGSLCDKLCTGYGFGQDCRCHLSMLWTKGIFNTPSYAPYARWGQEIEFGDYTQISRIPTDWGFKPNETDPSKLVDYVSSQSQYPPAAQIWFHGRDDITYDGETIIGVAVIDQSEFEKTYFGKYCGIFEEGEEREYKYTILDPEFGYSELHQDSCKTECKDLDHCGPAYSSQCDEYCEARIYFDGKWLANDSDIPEPCNYTPSTIGATGTNPNYIKVALDDEKDMMKLMESFFPYFDDRMNAYGGDWENDGCGKLAGGQELVISSVPWLPAYKKYDEEGKLLIKGSGSPAIYSYLKKNIYDRNDNDLVAIDSCSLRAHTKQYSGYHGSINEGEPPFVYEVLWPKTIFLLKESSEGQIGKCKVAGKSKMLDVKTFGWCEPCTLATLAYQKVKAQDVPYMPVKEIDIEQSRILDLCEFEFKREDLGGGSFSEGYGLTCSAPHISDIQDYYDANPTVDGAPRTIPEATLIKERMGDYLKSGVMPVIDLQDESNWNLTIPYPTFYYQTGPDSPKFYLEDYNEYDFERLLGNNGAIVVVVDTAGTDVDSARILKRTNLVRSHCWRCLTAVHVVAPDQTSFNQTLSKLFADSRMKLNVDLITFGYATSATPSNVYSGATTDPEKAEAVVDDMASYSKAVLKKYQTPSMITQFFVTQDTHWNDGNYEILFRKIIEQEDELVRSGLIGVIYAPVRDSGGWGIVDESSGVGIKSAKFCALEKATGLLAATNPRAQFAKSVSLAEVNCTQCTSIDKITGGCNMTCENGVECNLPLGAKDPSIYKCPEGTVLDECKLCNATSGIFFCNKTFVNGTTVPFNVSSQHIDSDIYGDIIGGVKKPNKCCLQDRTGNNYTYIKHTVANIVNAPIVYSKKGDPNQDCGMTSGQTVGSGAFCGAKLPVQDYDIECEFEEIPLWELNTALSKYNAISPETLIPLIQPP